jgi:hypothetical protein
VGLTIEHTAMKCNIIYLHLTAVNLTDCSNSYCVILTRCFMQCLIQLLIQTTRTASALNCTEVQRVYNIKYQIIKHHHTYCLSEHGVLLCYGSQCLFPLGSFPRG